MKAIIKNIIGLVGWAGFAWCAAGKMDLVTLPSRDAVQLTIYNSADLTLVREQRLLTLKQGLNRLQFSWANTLIDPTSLELIPKERADQIDVNFLTYPPRVQNLGVWEITSKISGKVPVEITYLTSGFAWRAFYHGILSQDEKVMRLEGYVRVTNTSGEDYENAQIRLIVGTIHVIDEIATLARQKYPYGSPLPMEDENVGRILSAGRGGEKGKDMMMAKMALAEAAPAPSAPKAIAKEGLSEYFLYTIEGTETIPTGWSKRLPSFATNDIPVVNLYKYEEERYGKDVMRFLSFKNDKKHKLGDTPIPGGLLRVFHKIADTNDFINYEGQSEFKYIPVDQEVELNLGAMANVIVEPTLTDYKTDRFEYNDSGNIIGWDEIRTFTVKVKNTRSFPIRVEVKRNFPTAYWDLSKKGATGDYEKVDLDTVSFTLSLAAQSEKEFQYTLTTRHGSRVQ